MLRGPRLLKRQAAGDEPSITSCPKDQDASRKPTRRTRRSYCNLHSDQPHDPPRCGLVGERHDEGDVPMRELVIGTVFFAAACGGPKSTPAPQAPPATTAAERS